MSRCSITNALLDDLVGAGMQRGRDIDAERGGGPEVEHQLERGRLHDRKVCRCGTLENTAGVDAGLAVRIRYVRPVADEAAGCGEIAKWIDHRNPKTRHPRDQVLAPVYEERIGTDKKRVRFTLCNGCESGLDLARSAGIEHLKLQPE